MPVYGQIIIHTEVPIGGRCTLTGMSYESLMLWGPRIGQAFTIITASGFRLRARVTSLGPESAELVAFEDAGVISAVHPEITLLQALPEKERMELIIQKTAELGVDRIIPLKTKRSTTLEERDSLQKKAGRWQMRALKASIQSRRDSIPEVMPYTTLRHATEANKDADIKIALWERPGLGLFKGLAEGFTSRIIKRAAILVGPEGGFDEEEMAEAQGAGFVPVSLGQNILRTETAAIISVGLLRHYLGE
ncbi:MAG: 16S rRNA (uracil(1498)-N(3))-methyltransferase [Deltaproteobacteria bacterium]